MNKQFLIIAIIAAIAIYLLGLFTCNGYYKGKYQCPIVKADTVKKYSSDTGAWHNPIADTKPIVVDQKTGRVSNIEWNNYHKLVKTDQHTDSGDYYFNWPTDSIGMIRQLQKQYSDLLNLFYKPNNYIDTTHLRNGIVKVQSIVQKNTLIAQRVILDSAYQTTITKTPTPITLKEKTQLWAGIDLYGNKHDYLSGAGISAMLKFPHIAITGGAYFDQYNNVNYSAGIKWLIRFKK